MTSSTAGRGVLRRMLHLWVLAALLLLTVGVVPARAATLANFPTSNAAVTSVLASPTNAYADDGVYATATMTKNHTVAHDFGDFGFDSIPVGATITSATLEIQFKLGSSQGDDVVRAQAYVSGVASGAAAVNSSQPTTDTILSTSTLGITSRTQLLDGTFAVRVTASRTTPGPPSHLFFLDYVKVTVVYTDTDTTPPVVTVPTDITTEATGPSGAVVTFSASAIDNVDGSLVPVCVPASGSTFALGTTTVTCSATDAAGNTGSASFSVTVVDTTPPVVTVPTDITTAATSPAGAVVAFSASATDLVDGAISPVCLPASGSLFPVGTTQVTCTATDTAGNTGSASFDVTVSPYVDDVDPIVTVPTDITTEATGPSGAVVTFSASAIDNVDGSLVPVCVPASGSTFALGTTTVTCSATDAAGNTGSASFSVTVVDTTPPVVTVPTDITTAATSPAGAVVAFSASATDLVDGAISPVCLPASGSLFPVGTTQVTCTATDTAGNTGSASFDVTVSPYVDDVDPIVTVPTDITTEATGPSGAVVTFSASAIDNVDGSLVPVCVPASGSTFALGTTTVTCSATDAAGNTGSASFSVTVVDTTPPVVTVPTDITTAATSPAGAVVAFSASATDLVDGAISPVCLPASGSLFPVGTTQVTCTATDTAGNTGSASFDVTVSPYVDDVDPIVTVPTDITTEATGPSGAVVTFSASAIDNVDGSLVPVCVPASGSTFALGTTTVTCSATDAAGNTGSASFSVTVVDTTPPVVTVPTDITTAATSPAGAVVAFSASATDLVDGAISPVCLPASGSLFPVGTTQVTCTATDTAGNTGSASFDVTVSPYVDDVDPIVTVPTDITTEATGPSGAVVTFSASAIDNVDGSLVPVCVPASGSTFALGTTTVTCSATDAAGNTGSASFSVTVVDTTPPVVTVPTDITTAATSPAGAVVAFSASATDLVDGAISPVCLPASGSLFPVGTTQVTCTATDTAGNTGSASFDVTVSPYVDDVDPIVTVPTDITTEATGPSGAVVTFSASAIDNVDGSLVPVCVPASGSTFALGTTTVTCSATDAAGNTGSASFSVTVVDTTPPEITTPEGGTPPDIRVPATGPTGAVVAFVLAATDRVDGAVPPTCTPASGSLFPVGTTTVSCTAVDATGNVASASFRVTVDPYVGPTPTLPPTATESPIATGTGASVVPALVVLGAVALLFAAVAFDRRRRVVR